jgi:dTDP-L-rhamnose 4-epimerase
VIAATVAGIELPTPTVDVVNVGSGVATTVTSIAQSLQNLLGITVPTAVSGQFRVGDIRHNVADLTRVRTLLGFSPSIDVDTGLRRFVGWVLGEKIARDRYEESLDELRAKGLFK